MSEELISTLIKQKEKRRLQAWELHQQGYSQSCIAKTLGVTQGAVSQWLKRVREGEGTEGLRHHPAPGHIPALSVNQLKELPVLLNCGATSYGFESEKWTIKRVDAVLKNHFGVSYHPSHISRLLKKYYPEWRQARNNQSSCSVSTAPNANKADF